MKSTRIVCRISKSGCIPQANGSRPEREPRVSTRPVENRSWSSSTTFRHSTKRVRTTSAVKPESLCISHLSTFETERDQYNWLASSGVEQRALDSYFAQSRINSGLNSLPDVTVELTTPHRTKIYWAATGRDNAEYALSFPLPSALYDSPPTPNDSSVTVESEPATRYLVK